jgi:glutathione S-transferase
MDLVLYYAPVTCALVPYVTLTEAGAPFAVRPLNFARQQHLAADYLRVNPKHKVPVLAIDGVPLTENVAIQIWIARNFPTARLLPADPMQELKAISLMSWCASGIHPFLFRIHAPQRCCDLPGAEESVRRLATQQLFETYRVADGLLQGPRLFLRPLHRRRKHQKKCASARISSGCSSAPACRKCSRMKKRCRASSRARRSPIEPYPRRNR